MSSRVLIQTPAVPVDILLDGLQSDPVLMSHEEREVGPGEGVVHHAGDVDGVEAGPPGHHHQPPGRGVDHHPAAGRHLILQCGDLSHITHHTLCITRYALHVTHYALHITRYT